MTSNQIGFMSNRISSDVLKEQNRHNTVAEDQNQQELDLKMEQQRWKEEYERRAQDLQRDYNDAYIAYLNASLEQKEGSEQRLRDIQQQQADNDEYYKNVMAQTSSQLAYLQRQRDQEQIRANKEKERLTSEQNWLTAQKLIYDATMFNVDYGFKNLQLSQGLYEFEAKQSVEWAKLLQNQQQIQINQQKVDLDKLNSAINAAYQGIGVITNVLSNYNFFAH